ncbi:uncharacterized protein LOC127102396 [Lathyrus oleraceus]|uniref:uncharacterized protein LOC127102396 n=1 Tax=Pisum sativum TaxID=3888 RepID=UPI0021D112DB|nr:uncharacterized protein LOC127102396 [Pisum sativum]
MVHPNIFLKATISIHTKTKVVKDDVKLNEVKDDVQPVVVEIDIGQHFRNEQLFTTREHMLEWARVEVSKLEFGIVIGRSNNGSNRRQAFATMRCERSDMCGVCEHKVIVRDIFWTHSRSIKLFNIFPTILIIDSTYKTNKYRFPLLGIIGVTSMKKTFSVRFAFLESEKEANVTRDL